MKKKKPKKQAKKVIKKKVRKPVVKKALVKSKKKVSKKKAGGTVKKQPAQRPSSIPVGASLEEVGVVTHYFPKVEAAVVKLKKGTLSLGDTIFIKGHTSDFKEKVESLQLDHVPIQNAEQGMEIGLRVKSKVREHDIVYKLLS